jgi:DNA-binding MarR family transcriptional regulator
MSTQIPSTDSRGVTGPRSAGPGAPASPPDSSTDALTAATAGFASAFERWSNRKAAEAGIGAQRLRLLNAVHCHGPQKMADLANALAVTPRNVTALVDGLEAEGLIRRVPHSTDRRITLVELTCSSAQVESQFRAFQDSLGSLFAGLSDGDRAALLRILTTLHDRIHDDVARPTESKAVEDA